jgi:hypothetical protein
MLFLKILYSAYPLTLDCLSCRKNYKEMHKTYSLTRKGGDGLVFDLYKMFHKL